MAKDADDRNAVIGEAEDQRTLTKQEQRIQNDVELMHKTGRAIEGAAPVGLGFVLTPFLLIFHGNDLYLGGGARSGFYFNLVVSMLLTSACVWAIAVVISRRGIRADKKFLVLTSGFFWITGILGISVIINSDKNVDGMVLAYGFFLGIALSTTLIAFAKYYSSLPLTKVISYSAASFLIAVGLSSLAIYTTGESGYYVFGIVMAVAGLFLMYRKFKDVVLEKWKAEPDKHTKTARAAKTLWPLVAACCLAEFLVGLTWNAYAGGFSHDTRVLSAAALLATVIVALSIIATKRVQYALRIFQSMLPLVAIMCVVASFVLNGYVHGTDMLSIGLFSMGILLLEMSVWIALSMVVKSMSIPASMLFGVRCMVGCIFCVLGIIVCRYVALPDYTLIGLVLSAAMIVFCIVGLKQGDSKEQERVAAGNVEKIVPDCHCRPVVETIEDCGAKQRTC